MWVCVCVSITKGRISKSNKVRVSMKRKLYSCGGFFFLKLVYLILFLVLFALLLLQVCTTCVYVHVFVWVCSVKRILFLSYTWIISSCLTYVWEINNMSKIRKKIYRTYLKEIKCNKKYTYIEYGGPYFALLLTTSNTILRHLKKNMGCMT